MTTWSTDVGWALSELATDTDRLKAYRAYRDYYEGRHPLAFATDKYRTTFWRLFSRLSDNLCMSVVDVQTERLEVLGFTTSAARTSKVVGGDGSSVSSSDDPVGSAAWDEWERNDLDLVSDEMHRDALMYGDAFLIVDAQGRMWPQQPEQMAVRYSLNRPGEIEAAAKLWLEVDGFYRVNVYLPGVIERWRSLNPYQEGVPMPHLEEAYTLMERMAADPQIPIVHFANRAYNGYGISELEPVLPLQDALNKSICDLIVSMEYQAFRQRWITGVEVEIDPETGHPKAFRADHGPGHFLAVPGEDVEVGEFDQADLSPFLNVIRDFRGELARVSGIPLHYFFVSGSESPSGEALKTAEIRFSKKTKRQQRLFGRQWERALTMALGFAGETEIPEDLDINAVWSAETPRSESEIMDVVLKKKAVGVPQSQLWKELGYDDDQIAQFTEEAAARAAQMAESLGGMDPEPGQDEQMRSRERSAPRP